MKRTIFLGIVLCSLAWSKDDAFRQALQDGSLEGSLYALYYDRKSDTDTLDYTAAVAGGSLEYTTAKTPGIYIRAKLQSTNPVGSQTRPEASRLIGVDGRGVDALAVAHLGLIDGNHLLTLGRQELDTPLMNGDTTRVIPYTYRGVGYQWDGPEASRIVLGKVEEIKALESRFFEPVSDSGELKDGVWYAGVEDQVSEGLGYFVYYYQAEGLYNAIFFQLDETFDWDGVRIISGLQYVKTYRNGEGANIDPAREEGGDDIALAGIRLGFKYDTYGLIVAHSENSGQDGLGRAYGGEAKLFTTTMITDGIHRGSPKTTSLRLKYDWTPDTSSRIICNLTEYGTDAHDKVPDSATNDYTSVYVDLKHAVAGDSLVYFQYEKLDKTIADTSMEEFRFSFVQWF